MSAFRTRMLSVLGSVVSVTACGAKVEHNDDAAQEVAGGQDASGEQVTTSEQSSDGDATHDAVTPVVTTIATNGPMDESVVEQLRKGLEGTDLCTKRTAGGSATFSGVDGLRPAETQDYLEWRYLVYMYQDGLTPEAWEKTKQSMLDDSSLSDAQRQQQLEEVFAEYVTLTASTGDCSLASGCDRFVLGPTEGLVYDPWNRNIEQLVGVGAAGSTVVTNAEELLVFLGTIDTPQEAALVARVDGYGLDCAGASYAVADDGFLLYAKRGTGCGPGADIVGYRLQVSANGSIQVLDSRVIEKTEPNCTIGRLPPGAVARRARGQHEHPVGRYFADVARLEAASILAFRELARDLKHHGAPPDLVAWAERAAVEETEHAALCRALARRYGVNLGPVGVSPSGIRSLLDIACDNACEGLTREAFGALVAHHQLHAAKDPAVRAALTRIARDETSHAEFSIALHRWLQTRLDSAERASVDAARLRARTDLGDTLHPSYAPDVVSLAGLPTPDVSRVLFEQLFAEDWAA